MSAVHQAYCVCIQQWLHALQATIWVLGVLNNGSAYDVTTVSSTLDTDCTLSTVCQA